ncbi:AraC family transcriptional regulator ligand-binding domain-containing protein [Burkholderia glumae]|uniref:AraC family transcriptional regulator ligand-binding domain-containing protein n=1 Tax=Burkholderia glumae TaxID=337 RepID=UPI0020B2FFD3|nr:AraC family transcriptional regulator ligand-binding domain-containing protein [Burkholderia glumae]
MLVDFGDERGVSHAALLAGTGLTDAQLDDPNVEVTAAQELRLTGNLLRSLGHPAGLGFEVGLRYHFSAYGVWGYGLIASATARDALALAMRFHHLPTRSPSSRIAKNPTRVCSISARRSYRML